MQKVQEVVRWTRNSYALRLENGPESGVPLSLSLIHSSAAAKQAGKKQSTLNIPGVKGALATFFFYCAIEAAASLWGASYLVEARGLSAEAAARGVSLYFLGITLGRFLSGFASMRMKIAALIRLGQLVRCV